ncbi:MAG TPA: SdpI family protein [Rhodanobacteraceae bacterium]
MKHAQTIAASVLLAGTGRRVPIPGIVTAGVATVLVVFGNCMGKSRKRFFIGIRSPWPRTHRLAGWLLVLAGVVWIAAGLADLAPRWPVGAAVVAVLIPRVGSYFIYRRVEGRA